MTPIKHSRHLRINNKYNAIALKGSRRVCNRSYFTFNSSNSHALAAQGMLIHAHELQMAIFKLDHLTQFCAQQGRAFADLGVLSRANS